MLRSVDGHRSVGHSGAIGGFRANIITYPGQKLNIAILTNFSSAPIGQRLNAISNFLLGEAVEEESAEVRDPLKTINLSKSPGCL